MVCFSGCLMSSASLQKLFCGVCSRWNVLLRNLWGRKWSSRPIPLPSFPLPKAMVCPVVMYGCESWTIKKAECQRIDAFELWCWRRLWSIPWTARRSKQSIPKENSLEYSLEDLFWSWNFNTLATWCKELTHWKRPWCWERLNAGREGDVRGWDG